MDGDASDIGVADERSRQSRREGGINGSIKKITSLKENATKNEVI